MTVMSTKAEDVRLWQQWNRTKSDHDLQQLLNHLQPVITQAVNRWGGTLARPMLETRAKALAVEAIRSYDPTRGATLATHVTNQLQKLSRTVYTHTAAARLPEHKAVSIASLRRGSLLAAIAHGRAIITTEPRYPIEGLQHEVSVLYVPQNNPQSLADSVRRVLEDTVLRTRLQTRVSEAARLYTWDRIAAQTVNVLEQVIRTAQHATRAP